MDLIGREAISDEILHWCDGAPPIAVKLIAGEHGAGKTRLCLDLCERLAERGWRVGFVGSIPVGTGIERWIWPEFPAPPAPPGALPPGGGLVLPQAHAERIVTFVRDYVSLVAELSREPDAELLGLINAKLKEIGALPAEGGTESD